MQDVKDPQEIESETLTSRRSLLLKTSGALASATLLLPGASQAQYGRWNDPADRGYRAVNQAHHCQQQYAQVNLVSDSPNTAIAKFYDPRLRSAWGIAQSSSGPWWVNNEASGLSTVYGGDGSVQLPVANIPSANPAKGQPATPTGIVFNTSQGFLLSNGKPATFLFSTLDGLLAGWNEGLPGGAAEVLVNHGGTSIYPGLATSPATCDGTTATFLYVPDFKAARVEVYDQHMRRASSIERAINCVPLPKDYAPFNVATVGPNVYVTYAKPDSSFGGLFPIVEAGNGLVVAFSPEGRLLRVLEHSKLLNGPWAVTLAPGNFGLYSHHLIIGNNGDGRINVYNPLTGGFIDQLRDQSSNPVVISGLWGMQFGNDTQVGGSATTLFFAASAGADFTHGLFGTLVPVQNAFGNSN
jgi:uncharacterized protein (TIGR03118 family)